MKSDEKKVFLETYSATFANCVSDWVNKHGLHPQGIPLMSQEHFAKVSRLAAETAVSSLKLKEIKKALGNTRRVHKFQGR